MTGEKFETNRFLKKNSVELLNNRLIIRSSSPFETVEFELLYDQIENKKTIETKTSFALIVFSSFTTIVGLLYLFGDKSNTSIIWFLFSLLFILIAFITKLKVITIKSYDGRNIELYFTKKNKQEVILFCDKIIDSANAYLLKKYSKIDRDLPVDNQIQNLIFLRNRELLSEEKFEQLKNQLLGKDNKSNIGYR